MNLKEIFLSSLIPGIPVTVITIIMGMFYNLPVVTQITIVLCIYFVFIVLIFLLDVLLDGWLQSRIDLWRIGKIRGLWREKGLIKQIKRCFSNSNIIKIKVTRGHDLLDADNEYGFKTILDNLKQGKGKKHREKVEIQFLLMIPCFQEDQVKNRYERHTDMSQSEFLETWYEFIREIRKYNSKDLSVNLRFYYGSHGRWRFYIFSRPNGEDTSVLLADYDRNTSGSSKPMYKIIRGEQNIGTFMITYFNDMWDSALTPIKLLNDIKSGKCRNGFCVRCVTNGTSCDSCKLLPCIYENDCKKFMEKYGNDLKRFNA